MKLGEIVDITSSKRIFAREYVNKGIPFYRGKEIIEKFNGRNVSINLFISEDKFYEIEKKFGIPQYGDILLTSVGTLGIPYIVKRNEKFYFKDGNLTWFRKFNGIDNIFLYYWIQSSIGKAKIMKQKIGSSQPALTIEGLKEIEINLPSIDEQRRIASILSSFDEKIEVNNRINEKLEETAKLIFQEWFINNEKLKGKSEKLSKLVKTQYGYTESAVEEAVGPKFLRVTDINKTDWIDWSSVPYCKFNNMEFSKYKLRKGDIVIARMADPGKVAIIEEDVDAIFASYLIRLKIISEFITPYFLFYYLRSQMYQNFIFGASTGTTRQSANARVITDVKLIIPPKEKLLEFENIAFIIRKKIRLNINENQKLSEMRDLLLSKLMKGEIRV